MIRPARIATRSVAGAAFIRVIRGQFRWRSCVDIIPAAPYSRRHRDLVPLSPRVQPNSNEDFVLNLLEEAGLVTRPQIDEACSKTNGAGGAVDRLIREGIVSEADVSRSLVAHTQVGWVDLSTRIIPPEIIREIRAEDAYRFELIPVGFGEAGLIVAVSDPLDIHTVENLRFSLQRQIELVCASPEQIRLALIKYYGAAKNDLNAPSQRVARVLIMTSRSRRTAT